VDKYTWESFPPSLYSIYFEPSGKKGWAAGQDSVIINTEDGGKTWKKIKMPPGLFYTLYKINVIGSQGWAVGSHGEYVVSSDGGKTWAPQPDKLHTVFWLRDLAFCDNMHGWVVGSRGTIVSTKDGGKSWEMVSGVPTSLTLATPAAR